MIAVFAILTFFLIVGLPMCRSAFLAGTNDHRRLQSDSTDPNVMCCNDGVRASHETLTAGGRVIDYKLSGVSLLIDRSLFDLR